MEEKSNQANLMLVHIMSPGEKGVQTLAAATSIITPYQ